MRRVAYIFLACLIFVQGDVAADEPTVDPPTREYVSYPAFELDPLAGTRFQYTASGGSGKDRCAIAHCLCSVVPGPPEIAATNRVAQRRLSIYFSEGSSEVNASQSEKVRRFTQSNASSSFTVVGYTDSCGTHEYNRGLAQRRSVEVKNIMRTSAASTRIDSTVFNAEHSRGHDPAVRRVDIIAHTSNRLTTMLDKIQADVYLVDASGSMWTGWKNWTNVIAVSFRPGSRVYLSKTSGCRNGQKMASVTPAGGTEIWYSYWKVLEWMKPGETLAVISDFRSDVPLTRRESALISEKVRQRNIRVIAVSP